LKKSIRKNKSSFAHWNDQGITHNPLVILSLAQSEFYNNTMIPNPSRFLVAVLTLFFFSHAGFAQTWEAYDVQGKLKTRAIFDRIEVLSETVITGKNQDGLFLLSRDLKPMVNLQGTEVYQYMAPWILVKGPSGIGAFHEYGQLAFALEYESIQTFFNFLLGKKGSEYWIFERGTGKTTALGTLEEAKLTNYGVLITKKDGNYYLPLSKDPEHSYELLVENEGRYLLAKEASGYGIINIDGDYVLDPVVDQLEHSRGDFFYGFDENQYLLIKGDDVKSDVAYNSYHKITKEGDLMLEYIHGKLRRVMEEDGILYDGVGMESVQVIEQGLYSVKFREDKIGLLGNKGWLVEPAASADWIKFGKDGFFPAGKNGKVGFVNSSGGWVIEPLFEDTGTFSEQRAKYKSAGSWGLIGPDGQVIAEAKWDDIKDFSSGTAVARAGSQFYLMNTSGQVVNESGFDHICRLKEGYFLVEKEGKRGLLDKWGKELLPIEFENIQVEKADFFIVRKEGLTGVVNEKGDVIFPISYQQVVTDWAGNQILVKDLYTPVIIQAEPTSGKRKKGA
jgi:hypothetical protein